MKTTRYIPVLLLVFMASCAQQVHEKQHTVSSLDSIYNYPLVKEYLTEYKGGEKAADVLFKKAVDAYRNKKQLSEAEKGFIASIKQQPTARAYYELGNVSMDQQQYSQAIDAYRIAERLNYKPVAKLLFNTACAFSRLGQNAMALEYLEYAIEAGYSNAEQIMKDEDLAGVRKGYGFQSVYLEAMSGASDPDLLLWHTYKRGFQPAVFPLVLNRDTKAGTAEDEISYEYEKFVSEMRDEKFSREVGKEFYYIAGIAENDQYTALVYASKDVMYDDEDTAYTPPASFVLISFDKKGKLIDKKYIGGQKLMNEPFKIATIQANLNFEVKEFDIRYEKDPEEAGYKDNKILSSELKSTRYYKIVDDGHFIEQQQSLTMR